MHAANSTRNTLPLPPLFIYLICGVNCTFPIFSSHRVESLNKVQEVDFRVAEKGPLKQTIIRNRNHNIQ